MRQQPEATPRPTVGDTLTVVHRIAVPVGALVEPRAPEDSSLATLVGAPDVRREGDSVRIAYTIAVWAPGDNELVIPGAIVVAPGGRIDTLPDARVALRVATVLPSGERAESIAPRAARPWVERATASALPFAVLLVPVLLALAAAAIWWRRRGPQAAAAGRAVAPLARPERITAWLDAGQVTMAVDHLGAALPDSEAANAWRQAVRSIRFDPAAADRLGELAREGLALLEASGTAR